MAPRWLVLAVLLSGSACGRVGFDSQAAMPLSDGGEGADAVADGNILTTVTTHVVALGVEGQAGDFLLMANYRSAADSSTAFHDISVLALPLPASSLRSLTRWRGDTVLAGSSASRQLTAINIRDRLLQPAPVTAELAQLANLHSLCELDSGNLIAGEYTGSSGAQVLEFDLQLVTSATPVYTTTVTGGTLGTCIERNGALFLSDENANDDDDGDIVKLEKSTGSWNETDRFDISTFAQGTYPNHDTGVFSFVASGNALFALPIRRRPGQIPKLIECPSDNLAGCDLRGELPADIDPSPNGLDTIMGASALPGVTRHFLFASNRGLYRYDLELGSFEMLIPIETISELVGESVQNLRHIVAFQFQ